MTEPSKTIAPSHSLTLLFKIAWAATALLEALEGHIEPDTLIHSRAYNLGKALAKWQEDSRKLPS